MQTKLDSERKEQTEQITKLKSSLDSLTSLVEQLKSKQAIDLATLDDLKGDIVSLRNERDSAVGNHTNAAERIDEIEALLSQANAKVESQEKQIQSYQEKISLLHDSQSAIGITAQQAEQKLAGALAKSEALSNELEAMTKTCVTRSRFA